MWTRILVVAALLAATATLAHYRGVLATPTRAGTPLQGFSAPFVYGRFQVPKDNPLTEESVALGRRLFYDPRLSGTNTVSCSTCHIQGLAFSDGKPTAVGVSGKPLAFNSMSLANLMWGPRHFFWNGRAASLEEQALVPLQHPDEMAQDLEQLESELAEDPGYRELFDLAYGEISSRAVTAALASFLRTLVSSNSRYDRFLRGELALSEPEELGRRLFMAHPDVKASLRGANCIDCHSQFLTSGFSTGFDGFANNGLDAEDNLPAGLREVTGKPEHRAHGPLHARRAFQDPGRGAGSLRQRDQEKQHPERADHGGRQPAQELAGPHQPEPDATGEERHHHIPAHADRRGIRHGRAVLRPLEDELSAMASRRNLSLGALLLAAAAASVAYLAYRSAQPTRLTLRFHPFVGNEALVLNEARYANPGGEGLFKVRDFQFFLSNIRLLADGVEFAEPESYHLVRFDSGPGIHVLVIENLPREGYRRIEFGIGVDPAANGSIAPVGDLDPNGRMAWSWDVGYKFVLFEGGLVLGDTQYPLVYHVGFNENYTPLSFGLDRSMFENADATLDFRTDLSQLFKGAHTLDMATLPNVKFDRGDARLLAENYAKMVSMCTSDCTL